MKYKVVIKKFRDVMVEAETGLGAERKAKNQCGPDELVSYAEPADEDEEEEEGAEKKKGR